MLCMVNEVLLWGEKVQALDQLPPLKKNNFTQNLEQELSALYHEFVAAQKDNNTPKQERVIRRLKWINRRILQIAIEAKQGQEPSTQALSFPQRSIHMNLYLKFLVVALGVTYVVLKNVFWEMILC